MKEYTDNEIVECLRNRQSFVVHYLSQRYMPVIRLMVFKYGGSPDDAADIFQESLLIILEKIDNREFELKCKFITYLYCVCENLCKDIMRKRKVAQKYISQNNGEVENDQSESMDVKLLESIFSEVFESLPHTHRDILSLHFQNLSSQEIADKLGYTYGYVKKIKSEGQMKLAEKVKQHPEYRKILSMDNAIREVVR